MADKITLKDKAYKEIKEAILDGALKSNDILQEVEMSEKLGMSRTPIRSAFLVLESEGLIKILPNRGAIVTKLDINDIVQISQAREALEGMATRLACGRIELDQLEEIEQTLNAEKQFYEAISDANHQKTRPVMYGNALHEIILYASGNEIIIKAVENLMTQFKRIMSMSISIEGRPESALYEHIRIVEALKKNDADLAEKRMREHIICVQNALIGSYQVNNDYHKLR